MIPGYFSTIFSCPYEKAGSLLILNQGVAFRASKKYVIVICREALKQPLMNAREEQEKKRKGFIFSGHKDKECIIILFFSLKKK